MLSRGEARAAQVAAMAVPDRVRLLGLIMSDPEGATTAERLAGGSSVAGVRRHLEALVGVGLLLEEAGRFRPSHDALVRFGGLVGRRASGRQPFVDHERILEEIIASLVAKHAGVLNAETVRAFVVESYDLIANRATVRRFLPQLTERFAADRLEALASLEEADSEPRDDVLFVCVRNAGRSQIAAALMRDRVGESIRIRTAGSVPAAQVHPVVRKELARRGLGALLEFPRPLTEEVIRASGVVVTMGCGDACPVMPGRRYVDWNVEDPVGRSRQDVRRIVDDISWRVDRLVAELRRTDR